MRAQGGRFASPSQQHHITPVDFAPSGPWPRRRKRGDAFEEEDRGERDGVKRPSLLALQAFRMGHFTRHIMTVTQRNEEPISFRPFLVGCVLLMLKPCYTPLPACLKLHSHPSVVQPSPVFASGPISDIIPIHRKRESKNRKRGRKTQGKDQKKDVLQKAEPPLSTC